MATTRGRTVGRECTTLLRRSYDDGSRNYSTRFSLYSRTCACNVCTYLVCVCVCVCVCACVRACVRACVSA